MACMGPQTRRPIQSAPPPHRHRPYSNTSSIKSIIHGPSLQDIEEELRKLEMEDDRLNSKAASSSGYNSARTSVNQRDNNKHETSCQRSRSSPSLESDCARSGYFSARSSDIVHEKQKQKRPKTCAANFPMRTKTKLNNPINVSKYSSERALLPSKYYINTNEVNDEFRRARANESLSERHEWRIRGNKELPINGQNEEQVPKRRLRLRVSTSAPPGKMSLLRTSLSLGNMACHRTQSARPVQAFTPASRMDNTVVIGPKRLKVFQPRPSPPTTFRRMYDRGDIPVTLQHDYRGQSLRWKVDLEKLDYQQYLPLFFDGLRETRHPYDFFSRAGVRELLNKGGDKIVPLIPQLILPMKSALNTRIPGVVCTVLRVIQELVLSAPAAGEALVPYHRQLLPTLNLFQHKNVNCGDEIDYSQQRKDNLGDLIQETLEMLERHGGKDAYINIKYMVPTYQSCIN